jgi:hypothetical protein
MSRHMLLILTLAGCLGVTACGGSATRDASKPATAPPTGTAAGTGGNGGAAGTTGTIGGNPAGTPNRGGDPATPTTGGAGTATAPAAGSRTKQVLALKAGGELSYTLVLPAAYRAGGTYPVLLALPPGAQGQAEVDALLDRWWAKEGSRRGWIVVSPVAPEGEPFFSGSSKSLIDLMDAVAATYPPEGGTFHLAGVSNGGLSAYRIAIDAPGRVRSQLVAPGFPPEDSDRAKLRRLVRIPVAAYVGEQDAGWREASARTVTEINRLGGIATLTLSPGEGHILQKITAAQLFDVLDSSRSGR